MRCSRLSANKSNRLKPGRSLSSPEMIADAIQILAREGYRVQKDSRRKQDWMNLAHFSD